MIHIKNFSKSYQNQLVLENVNMEFKSHGLYFIYGPSGCGKTTLINAISGLVDFEGEIIINGINIKTLSDYELAKFRLENIGYVFQDFNLFNYDKVIDNVLLPSWTLANKIEKRQYKKALDILKLIDILELKDSKISELSGGQKQKVCIARALINDAKIILCDEPTGSLDSKNKIEIMNILKILSASKLVIVISHDKDLVKQFNDYTYEINNHNIVLTCDNSNLENKRKKLPIINCSVEKKKPKLSLKFLFKHSKNYIKRRPFRTFITNFVVSFGFLSIGLSLLISDTIYSSVTGVYSNIVSDNQVVVTTKNIDTLDNDIISLNENAVKAIINKYPNDILNYGICYLANFEEYFVDLNHLTLADTTYRYVLRGYSIRLINDFIWLSDNKEKIYPNDIENLKDDEIVLSIDPFMLSEICYQLRIERTIDSLSKYIQNNNGFRVCFELANESWQYHDEQTFNVKGFIISNNPTIYHSNPLFNEYVFEEMMRFKSNTNITQVEYYPWILKKCYYLKLITTNEEFLRKVYKDTNLINYIFEIANQDYYPWLYNETSSRNIDRILVFNNPFLSFNYHDYNEFKLVDNNIYNPIFSSFGGYSVYGTSLLSGFTNMIFLSSQQSLLDETTGLFSSYGFAPDALIQLPKGVVYGHYSKTSMDGVFFKTLDEVNLKYGNIPNNYTQFVISSGLAKKLFANEDVINQTIYLSMANNDSFVSEQFNIVGVVENDKNIIYHDNLFSLLFFQCQLGISAFDLVPIGMSFDVKENIDSQVIIEKLKNLYPYYDFINPMYDIKIETDKLCFYLEMILIVLSLLTMIVAICLVSICNYMHLLEIKKDIGLLRCIGISKNESSKLLFSHSLSITMMGVISSCLQLGLIFLAFKYGIAKLLNVQINLNFSIQPYIFMILFSLIIGIISAVFFLRKVQKLDTIQCLKNR